jgi:hypothetical protein
MQMPSLRGSVAAIRLLTVKESCLATGTMRFVPRQALPGGRTPTEIVIKWTCHFSRIRAEAPEWRDDKDDKLVNLPAQNDVLSQLSGLPATVRSRRAAIQCGETDFVQDAPQFNLFPARAAEARPAAVPQTTNRSPGRSRSGMIPGMAPKL